MSIENILDEVFRKMNKENVMETLREKLGNWNPVKKNPKKAELKEDFMGLARLIKPDEIEDFIEMAVMARTIGLPAYTYRVTNLNFLNSTEDETRLRLEDIEDRPFQENLITIEGIEENETELKLTMRMKEYAGYWRLGVRNTDTLSAVYKIEVLLDKENLVATIFTGNHHVQEVVKNFLSSVLKWPIQSYKIREIFNQVNEIGSASYKTAILLDFIFSRLEEKGINSRYKEMKFNTKNTSHTNQGIRNITINGSNLLSSQLACEYITMGSDILSFKVDMTYNEIDFSALFFLKGSDFDILKIVVTGQDDVAFKQDVITIIQEEYIQMCNYGISNIENTKELLQQIYRKFINGDKLVNQAIQNSSLKIIDIVVKNLRKFDLQDEELHEMLSFIYKENKIILDSAGYAQINEGLNQIKQYIELDEEEIESYDEDALKIEDEEQQN
ncbi:hypothetical protein [Bacillus cereus]